ncbi:MAG TPA: FAD-dependent oxidoreductase [Candidatus Nanoarchaeia archaeon]|nr:FAD-dependent oxidoreductase [Candidatus Nanoarchaeia archaeon]
MKKVVVIGGGFAGSYAARELQNGFEVTLIDTKDYFEFTPSVLRCLVEPEHLCKIQAMHKEYFKGELIVGKVSEVFLDYVVVNGGKIEYDYLVICSGSKYNAPFKEEVAIAGRGAEIVKYAGQLEKAEKILIIGGGIVGVELAGEILDKYPGKKITIVHSHRRLMQRCSEKSSRYAEKYLLGKGVEIVFNDRVVKGVKGDYTTEKKNKIFANMAFLCTGIKANSGLLKRFNGVYDKEFVRVNEHLQLFGYEKIFVGGDVNNIIEEKTAQNAEEHGKVIVENIRRLDSGKPLVDYKNKRRVMVVSLGKRNGIFMYGNIVLTGRVIGRLKDYIERREMGKYRLG